VAPGGRQIIQLTGGEAQSPLSQGDAELVAVLGCGSVRFCGELSGAFGLAGAEPLGLASLSTR
jgi:hypothetical protein